jgi:uncharacterized NAD(P)/FAD-binding protein YdhS
VRQTTVRVARVINCTGPQNDLRKSSDPLVNQIVADGIGRSDPCHLGFETALDGALIRANGVRWENIFALGPTRKGTLWETIAVPEIRLQAAALAHNLLSPLQNRIHSTSSE